MSTKKTLPLIPLEVCFKYVEILERTNDQAYQLNVQTENLLKVNKVSQDFYNTQNKVLLSKVNANNEIIDALETKIFDHMKRTLGGNVFLPNRFPVLEESVKQEIMRYEKIAPKQPEATLDPNPQQEAKVLNLTKPEKPKLKLK